MGERSGETRFGLQWDSQGMIVGSVGLELGFISSFDVELHASNCSGKVDFQ